MARSKDIGTAVETGLARFLQQNGWPYAERRALRGTVDAGDITGTPGICWEAKGGKAAETASDKQVLDWLRETEIERLNARENVGILVMKRKGVSAANAGRWWAVLHASDLVALAGTPAAEYEFPVRLTLADATELLRAAGYGNPPES